MKKIIIQIALAIMLQNATAQNQQMNETYSGQVVFVQAKINNEDPSKFFINFPYDKTITNRDGNVLVSFIVKRDGKLDSIQVLNDPGILWKETALIALNQSSGYWNPSRMDDKIIDKKYFASFNFTNGHDLLYKKDRILRLMKAGESEKPLKIINEAIKINPFDTDLLMWRAKIYSNQNKPYLEALDLLLVEKLKSDLIFNILFL
jgi:hypothetical protein